MLTSGGCGIELAMIGAAASAASQGSAVYKSGKLNVAWMGDFDEVVAAGEIAGNDLGLLIVSTVGDAQEGTWKTKLTTSDGEDIVIKTMRKTPQMVHFQIDVGWFGHESMARLLLKRMAVAIRLDANADGSGEVLLPPPPAPAEAPPEITPPVIDDDQPAGPAWPETFLTPTDTAGNAEAEPDPASREPARPGAVE